MKCLIALLALMVATSGFAIASSMNDCLVSQINNPDNENITAKQIKQQCAKLANTLSTENSDSEIGLAIQRRISYETIQEDNPFSLKAHKPNYIILSNNTASPNEQPFDDDDPDHGFDFQPWETKFQFSMKVKVPGAANLIKGQPDLYVAYTNRSFWQMFNKEGSAPFRDSNHEPEMWLSFKRDQDNNEAAEQNNYFGWHNAVNRIGIVHQSNGQSGALSRSWNRLYADFIFERDNWYLSFKPWWRIPEHKSDDDNPDIDRYLGNFELSGVYKKDNHNFDFMIRNSLRGHDNYGAFQLGWSFSAEWLPKNTRGYIQWFNGYGESLIDYDAHSNSIGLGLKLTDWL